MRIIEWPRHATDILSVLTIAHNPPEGRVDRAPVGLAYVRGR